jgi:uncharacterized protein (TIGR02231 family)
MAELSSTITAVTVYPDRARVVRSGAITLEPGLHRLELPELPLCLDPASVRAAARGTAQARVLGIDAQRRFYAETPTERVRQLEGQIETLGDELRAVEAQAALLKQEQSALGELAGQTRVYARGLASGKTDPAAYLALLDVVRLRVQNVNASLAELASRQRTQGRRLEALQKELDQLRSAKGRERYTAVVEAEVLQAGELTVELSYVVSNAGWQPLYDLRLREDGQPAELEVGYLAQVTQRTGEDWPAVMLALSTARPALAATLPELDVWYIQPSPQPPVSFRPAPAPMAVAATPAILRRAGAEPEAEMPGPPLPEVAAQEVMASVESAGAAITYRIPGTTAVPADGAPHKATIARFELSPNLDYVSAPKLVEAAYRRARVTNASSYTLLPGQANLFAGDEFIGTTRLELTAPQGELELYLGADDRVKVQRELKRHQVDKRLMGNTRRLHYGYQLTLENLLPSPVQLTLHDQLPVARHENITVRLESIDPKPAEQTELNLLKWELTLAPGQKVSVRFDFAIEHPQGMRVSGLP